MIKITNSEAKLLRENGFGRMITVANKGHRSKQKTHYLSEQQSAIDFYNQHFGAKQ